MSGPSPDRGRKRLIDLDLVSLKELAARWHVSRRTVRRSLEEAGIKPFYLGNGPNGTLRYAMAEVEEFLRRRRSDLCGPGLPAAASRLPGPQL